jgi:hypothetical protein
VKRFGLRAVVQVKKGDKLANTTNQTVERLEAINFFYPTNNKFNLLKKWCKEQ